MFGYYQQGRYLTGSLGDLAIGPALQPSGKLTVGFFDTVKIPDGKEIVFDIFNQVFHLALNFRIGFPADIHPEILFLDKILKIPGIDDIPGIFTDDQ